MCGDCADLLRRAREELFHAKVTVRSTRNQTKTAAATLAGCEERIDALVDAIEGHLNGSPDQEVQGHGEDQARTKQVGLVRC